MSAFDTFSNIFTALPAPIGVLSILAVIVVLYMVFTTISIFITSKK